ncbi:Heteroglycan glucosidase 1 [Citrus sinensis]|uniref:Heteroglycan glucosidase 1 n=1 Tax=Citrus sinensis TaxID=2711 RepID=A0ACB8JQ71_CITSI|nr:Heteroglycan glucosidase 1 [Citrus sinensis]
MERIGTRQSRLARALDTLPLINVFTFPAGTLLYGTGEVSGQLERTGKRIFTWNTDSWGYGTGTTSLCQSHPWVLAVLPNGEALGVLADTTRRCAIDLRKESTIQFIAPSSYPVITFGPFTSPTAVLVSLSHAVGTVFMPPKWSLGYHQCRWSYDSDKRVREERFPDPKYLATDLHLNGFKAIWMLDPGIKHEDGYFVYDSGSKIDVWIQKADGTPFIGEVWPGPCVFPDYTQSKVRSWWASLVKDFIYNGVDGIWNDMNEAAVFKSVTKTMPESNIHRGDDEIGGCQNHSYYHNVYGMLMARSTYEGMTFADKDKRPFVLTRAGFIGSQRYVATWTGDNVSNWEHLHMSISMGLSGQPHLGPDIGGFAGNATPRLFGRWMGIVAMFPFCRGHSETDTIDHEPWSFGEESKDLTNCGDNPGVVPCINFKLYLLRVLKKNDVKAQPRGCLIKLYAMSIELDLRRSMVKLIAHTTGTLVASPTFFADPEDVTLRKLENSFLLGPVLVCASTLPDQRSDKLQHALPKGIWQSFDFEVHIRYLFLDALPSLYLRGGSILPLGPPHQHIGESKPSDDLTLLVALDENENAKLISDAEKASEHKGVELSQTPIELKSGDWALKVVPWIGGRVISMAHFPSGTQWLHSRVDVNGYEEYCGTEYRSAGCTEEYSVVERSLQHGGEEESLMLEDDIGGGLILQRKLTILKDNPKIFKIDSKILARKVGAGSGGFSRQVCLRVHPMFTLLHPTESFISFTSIDGSKQEIWPESGEQFYEGNLLLFYEGNLLPNGEWMLVDKCQGLALVNRFNVEEVFKCFIRNTQFGALV